MLKIIIILFLCCTLSGNCTFGLEISRNSMFETIWPVVKPTEGEIWPKPKHQITRPFCSIIRPFIFKFKVIEQNCDLLDSAIHRYIEIIRNQSKQRVQSYSLRKKNCGYLNSLQIKLTKPCQTIPKLYMDESYKLIHMDGTASIESNSIWGVLRGLESFSQMLVTHRTKRSLHFKETEIYDEPRFSHRGLLIDTSRHYLNILTIYCIIDGMTYNKLNVLHWHIVDDHSFPYESIAFPELSEKGAYHPSLTYTQEDVRNIIEYARVRGIRIMPEFDTPGHTRSWGLSHSELLTECCGEYKRVVGPFNPILQNTYDFMQILLKEIVSVFPDNYIHLGGDEVGYECWASNRQIRNFVYNKTMTIRDLGSMYMEVLIEQVTKLNVNTVVWQEVFENIDNLPLSTIVQVWLGNRHQLLSEITNAGYKALLSESWYLDHTDRDWEDFYAVDPHDFHGPSDSKKLVVGGEACMWGETIDDTNVIQSIFPRVSAVAERLWSFFDEQACYHDTIHNAKKRIEEHTCRMILRGVPSSPPNGPGFCA